MLKSNHHPPLALQPWVGLDCTTLFHSVRPSCQSHLWSKEIFIFWRLKSNAFL